MNNRQFWFTKSLWMLMLLSLLASCRSYPQEFDHPMILRGTWVGEVRDYPSMGQKTPLRLELTATYVDEKKYQIRGNFILGLGTPQALSGEGSGAGVYFVRPTSSRPHILFEATVPAINIELSGSEDFDAVGGYRLVLSEKSPCNQPVCVPSEGKNSYYGRITRSAP